jgi:hypothetical protein
MRNFWKSCVRVCVHMHIERTFPVVVLDLNDKDSFQLHMLYWTEMDQNKILLTEFSVDVWVRTCIETAE